MAEYRGNRDVLALLKEAQEKPGYLAAEKLQQIARDCRIPVGHLYGVATFYGFLDTRPVGRNVIRICQSVPCYLKEVDAVAKAIEDELGIKPGEITGDGRFSLHRVNCLGACDHAPAMMVNGRVHVDLTPSSVIDILGEYR